MGVPSHEASNAIIYTTYAAFLYRIAQRLPYGKLILTLCRVFGLYVAWTLRQQTKGEFLSSNRTQKGQNRPCDDLIAVASIAEVDADDWQAYHLPSTSLRRVSAPVARPLCEAAATV